MQLVIQFLVNTIRAFVETCMNNELLSWFIFLFVLGVILWVFSTLWRR